MGSSHAIEKILVAKTDIQVIFNTFTKFFGHKNLELYTKLTTRASLNTRLRFDQCQNYRCAILQFIWWPIPIVQQCSIFSKFVLNVYMFIQFPPSLFNVHMQQECLVGVIMMYRFNMMYGIP